MRVLATLAAAGLAALLAAAVAVGADGNPRRALTKNDQARAKASVVRRADLGPGWSAVATAGRRRGEDVQLRCDGYQPDESDLTVTGDAISPDFQSSTPGAFGFVSSRTTVYATAAQARTSWARTVRPELIECFVGLLRREVSRQPVQSGALELEVTGSAAAGFPRVAPRRAAFRVTGVIVSGQVRLPLQLDVVLLGSGRANAGVVTVSVFAPLPRATQVRLARAVAARLR